MSVRYITVFTVILATWLAVSPVLADNVTFFSQSLILLAKNEDQPLKGNDPSRESPASENSAHTDSEPGKSCSNHDQTGHGCAPAQPPAETVSLPQDTVSPDPVQPPPPPTSVQIVPEPDPVQITPEPEPVPVIPEPESVQIIPEIEELPITSEVEPTEIEPAQVISEPVQTAPEIEEVPTTSEVELIQTEETEPVQIIPEIKVVPATPEAETVQVTPETEPAQTAPEIEVVPTTSEVEPIQTEKTEPVQIIPEIKIVPATPEAETVQITPQTEPAQTISEAEEEVPVIPEVELIQTEETEPVQPILPQPTAVPNPVINTVICSEGPFLTATCVGQQRLFNNLTVAAGASVSEIILNGTITNQGWISNATILAGSTLTGGTLTGSIFNEGTVNDITFKGSKLSGGYVGGAIGIAQKGAILENVTVLQDTQLDGGTLINAQIMDGVTLTNVTLGQGTQLSENVIIGQEVRFIDNAQIPVGTNLTAAFSTRFTPEMPKLLDLHIEVLDGPVPTLLQQINQIPELQANQWQFEQNPWNGQLQLDINGVRFALLPVQVTQVAADQAVGMTVNPDDSIRFVTSYGREILAQPIIQDMEAFRQALGLDATKVQVTTEGIIKIQQGKNHWNAYRASVESDIVGDEYPIGLFDAPEQNNAKQLIFLDETGQKRAQLIHATCAYPEQWQTYQDAASQEGSKAVLMGDGRVSVSVAGKKYQGMCSSSVTVNDSQTSTQQSTDAILSFTPSKEGLLVTYANGEQQTFYATLEEEFLEESTSLSSPYGQCQTRRLVTEEDNQVSVEETFSTSAHLEKLLPRQAKQISHDESSLEINEMALSANLTVSIKSLRDRDLAALDVGMVNVTKGPRKGYRFLPHRTKFQGKQKIKLPYDKKLLPDGATEQDITTFYFDEEVCKWLPLEKVSVDTKTQEVVSYTDHFTDMINSVVTVPEAPETVAYNPNQLKDIKAADPGTGVSLIEPPQANNMGGAGVSYPLEVPPGRAGLQPQLAVQYNSSGGNGWLGLGWDVAMQTVTIDTRWGVPRYDTNLETETYTLSGQQLTPLAHRGELQSRTTEKMFHPRIEGSFTKIIRHGDNPKNYWWEVTDKNGTVSSYGGEGAVLIDDHNNIFVWALREVRDTHGNTMNYRYKVINHTGLAGGTVPGRELYLKSINYTGYQGEAGPYQVVFLRDRDLHETERVDVNIDARGGFKRVTADLLRKVEVSFNGQKIRSYELKYEEGAFKKMLLSSLTQYGEDGSIFNSHSFDYYDDIRNQVGDYNGFGNPEEWNTKNDNVSAKIISVLAGKGGHASALGGTMSRDIGGHLYLGIKPKPGSEKKDSVGFKLGYTNTKSIGMLAFMDINGDGLPDKIYKDSFNGRQVYYRPQLKGVSGPPQFGGKYEIATLDNFSEEKSDSFSGGAEAYVAVTAGINIDSTKTKQIIYFSDVNGDGLPDLVKDGEVLFNHLNSDGHPEFTSDSSATPAPIITSGNDPQTTALKLWNADDEALYQENIEKFPLIDAVRRWIAPYPGVIRISGEVALVESTDPERQSYKTADGVRVAIQHNDKELWTTKIGATDYGVKTPAGVEAVSVNRGDVIYFRVQSVLDASYDQVNWQPDIQYVNTQTVVDANQLEVFHYNASKDFTLAGQRDLYADVPIAGKVRVTGELQKLAVTSDDVAVIIYKDDLPVYTETLAWNKVGSFTLSQDIEVTEQNRIVARVQVDSPIDLTQLQWHPSNPLKLFYVESPEIQMLTDADGQPTIQMDLPSNYDVYPESNLEQPLSPWIVPETGSYTVSSLVGIAASGPELVEYLAQEKKNPHGTVVMTVKRAGELVGKYSIKVVDGQVLNGSVDIQANQNDALYVEFSTADYQLVPLLSQIAAGVTGGGKTFSVPTELHSASPKEMIAQRYRGWSAFGYDGNGERAAQPMVIMPDDLTGKSLVEGLPTENLEDPQVQAEISAKLQERKLRVLPYYPEVANQRWKGTTPNLWIAATVASSSRNGPAEIDLPPGKTEETKPTGGTVSGVTRKSRSLQTGLSLSLDLASLAKSSGSGATSGDTAAGPSTAAPSSGGATGAGAAPPGGSGDVASLPQLSASLSNSRNSSEVDYLDLNGDRFPDEIKKGGGVSFSQMTGIRSGDTSILGEFVRESLSDSLNFGVGGNFTKMNKKQVSNKEVSLGLSGNLSKADSEASYDLMDINGDGLPDRVRQSGDNLLVAFNLGYGFAKEENWGTGFISRSRSKNGSMGPNLGYNKGKIYQLAGGLSLTCGTTETSDTLIDINGDGLLDKVRVEDKDTLLENIIKGNCMVDLTINTVAGNISDVTSLIDSESLQTDVNSVLDKVQEVLSDTDKFIKVNLNTGNGFAEEIDWPTRVARGISVNTTASLGGGLYITIGIPIYNFTLIINPGFNYSNNFSRPEVAISDADGDGNPDYLYSNQDGKLVVAPSLVRRTNLLKTVHRPLGASFTISYERQGNTYNQSSSSWVMSKVEMFDGHPGDGVDKLVTTYRYENGFYDRQERDFYGYQAVVSETRDTANQVYRAVTQTFYNDSFYNKGLLHKEVMTDATGKRYSETENTYVLRDVNTGQPLAGARDLTATVFPALVRVDKRFYEGHADPGKTTYETYEYDALGNVVTFVDTGEIGATDDVHATIGYFFDAAHHINKPNSIVVTNNGVMMRKREADFVSGTGELSQVRQYITEGQVATVDIVYSILVFSWSEKPTQYYYEYYHIASINSSTFS